MKRYFLWIVIVLAPVGFVLAAGKPRPVITPMSSNNGIPTLTPDSTKVPQASFSPTPSSPTPTRTPFLAPTWAPESAGAGPSALEPKKSSPWMTSVGIGVGIPISSHLQNAYSTGFNFNLGSGYKLSDRFSLWVDLDLDLYNSKNDALTGGNNYTLINAALWGRYRLLDSDSSPYLFGGPGLGYNEYRGNVVVQYDPTTGQGYIPVNSYEVDFLVEGGFGMEMRLGGGLTTYLQGKITYSFTSPRFAGFAYTDSPIMVVPLELGILLGI